MAAGSFCETEARSEVTIYDRGTLAVSRGLAAKGGSSLRKSRGSEVTAIRHRGLLVSNLRAMTSIRYALRSAGPFMGCSNTGYSSSATEVGVYSRRRAKARRESRWAERTGKDLFLAVYKTCLSRK